jgi:ribonucrease Y
VYLNYALAGLAGLILGVIVMFVQKRRAMAGSKNEAEENATRIIEAAKRSAEDAAKEIDERGKKKEQRLAENEQENTARRAELQQTEERLNKKEENIEKKREAQSGKESELAKRENATVAQEKALVSHEKEIEAKTVELEEKKGAVEARKVEIEEKKAQYDGLIEEAKQKVEEVAGMSREDARKRLHEAMIDEVKHDAAKEIRQLEEEAKIESERRAKKIISTAISRYSGEYVGERTVSVVNLPNEDMKGRIIGREGRNIKAFEAITGIDLIIDNTPEAVILSGYSPVRRQIAKISLEKLLNDGRIHPSRIEEVVKKTEKEVDQAIKEAGEFAIFELGLHGVHPDLLKTLGSLKYRMSYAQNILAHSIEVAFITGMMCDELGLDVKMGRRAGLFHDIGKAVDHKIEGPHALIGADLLKKHGENPDIIHAVAAHHEDEKPRSVLAVLVTAADSLSGARPGARREMLESYIARLEKLEAIANGFGGVQKTFAIQAGRELRVIVGSDNVNDDQSVVLARDIAKKIESDLTYPGQIRVTVIRETRSVAFAK